MSPDAESAPADPSGEQAASGPSCNFAQFLVSLGHSALVHLGEVPSPETGSPTLDLPLARYTVDVLRVLQDKTKGNLDSDEEKLLGALLDELGGKLEAASTR